MGFIYNLCSFILLVVFSSATFTWFPDNIFVKDISKHIPNKYEKDFLSISRKCAFILEKLISLIEFLYEYVKEFSQREERSVIANNNIKNKKNQNKNKKNSKKKNKKSEESNVKRTTPLITTQQKITRNDLGKMSDSSSDEGGDFDVDEYENEHDGDFQNISNYKKRVNAKQYKEKKVEAQGLRFTGKKFVVDATGVKPKKKTIFTVAAPISSGKRITYTKKPGPQFSLGQKIRARWNGEAHFYPGVIKKVSPEKLYTIAYDDGELETRVKEDYIREDTGSNIDTMEKEIETTTEPELIQQADVYDSDSNSSEYVEEGEWVLSKAQKDTSGKKTKEEIAASEKNRKKREKKREKERALKEYLKKAPENRELNPFY